MRRHKRHPGDALLWEGRQSQQHRADLQPDHPGDRRIDRLDAALPVVIIAGERYGTGSSRDWAAKGAQLLGVRAVLANSFERIHRANLVCMGVLPLRLPAGWRFDTLGIAPGDTLEIAWNPAALAPRASLAVTLRRGDGTALPGVATAELETAREVALVQGGGMIPTILRQALAAA